MQRNYKLPEKNTYLAGKKVMFQHVSSYYLKAFELNISKYQLMKEDFSKKTCANIRILLSDFQIKLK